jgi:hypothetical protein
MYSKVFEQIFDSSISEDYMVRHIFMDLLVLADREGQIDMTAAAIARRTNVPLRIIEKAIVKLSEPDKASRTPEEEGRRLVLLDEHRDWGWRIVNYKQYNAMRNEEARRDYFREYKKNYRARKVNDLGDDVQDKVGQSTLSTVVSTVSTHVYTHADVDVDVKNIPPPPSSARAIEPTDDECDVIYQAYPRKVGKVDAYRAIRRAVKSLAQGKDRPPMQRPEALQFLLRRVGDFRASPAGQAGEFTPHPASWFNKERYLDDDAAWQRGGSNGQPGTPVNGGGALGRQQRSFEAIALAGEAIKAGYRPFGRGKVGISQSGSDSSDGDGLGGLLDRTAG